jgi:hypothetical protein
MADISNRANTIDTRHINERIEELEGEREALESDVEEAQEALDDAQAEFDDADAITQHNGVDPSGELTANLSAAKEALAAWDKSDEAEELATLKAFRDELEPYCSDWHHGETLIRDSYFKEYAQELAEDIGAINRDAQWPNNCIDWDKATRELQMDYTSAELDGVTYWVR